MIKDHGIIHFYDPKNLDHEKWFTQNLVIALIAESASSLNTTSACTALVSKQENTAT